MGTFPLSVPLKVAFDCGAMFRFVALNILVWAALASSSPQGASVGDTVCHPGECDEESGQSFVSLLQVKATRSRTDLEKRSLDRPECVAVLGVEAAYRFGAHGSEDGLAAADTLTANGYNFVRGWNVSAGHDWDYMGWWEKDGDCMITFQGSDAHADFYNNWNPAPVEYMGIPDVHAGLVAELSPLVAQINFAQVRGICTGELTVVGHSLGGGLAQLFSIALNKQDDPLGANLRASYLYTFGAMPVGDTNEENDQDPGGCFNGQQYWNALRGADGSVSVDVVAAAKVGGQVLVPIKSKKILQFAPGDSTTYECGVLLPSGMGGTGFALHSPRIYAYRAGCD